MRTRTGKVARLPHVLREEVCRRLRDGQTASAICAWLNSLPEVREALGEHFNSPGIDDENMRAWRAGGYVEWLARQERLDHVRGLADYAMKLAAATGAEGKEPPHPTLSPGGEGNGGRTGTIAEGASAIASGMILELLEACDGKMDPEQLGEIIFGLTNLRKVEVAQERAGIAQARLKQIDESLGLERAKFQRTTCELFLKWRGDERARQIADGPASNAEKIEQLGEAMFGELWK